MLRLCAAAFLLLCISGDGEAYGYMKRPYDWNSVLQENKCASGSMSGWDWLSRRQKQVLLRRTYNFTGNPNDSICIQARFKPIVYQNHTLEKTFTYRNMSSTQVIKDTVVQPWPVAKFFLYFYAADDTMKGTRRDDLFNYVNSSLIYNSVKCELWVSMKISEKPHIHKWNEDHPCVRYFSTACYTQYSTEVYDPALCGE
ncbi:uncharacterized protein LOC119182197 isoform X2 [Rhipicephalus microplus]|uniref:uncharacterized protein LOC119182197 isoform X2 n=1 Tax=Rhipicephalus microplus TaxID=6941 RepID=UPI003F6CBDBB